MRVKKLQPIFVCIMFALVLFATSTSAQTAAPLSSPQVTTTESARNHKAGD